MAWRNWNFIGDGGHGVEGKIRILGWMEMAVWVGVFGRGKSEWRNSLHTFLQFCLENRFIIVLMPVPESTVLGVYISQLRLGVPLSNACSLLLILSLSKKSAQMTRPYRPSDPSCLHFDQTLSIDCSDLDMLKHKYCLLFVYEVDSCGKKTTLGNIPVNIRQNKARGEKVYRLLECSDAQSTITVAVDLAENQQFDFQGCGSVISQARTSEVRPSPLSFLRCRPSLREEEVRRCSVIENEVKQIGDIPLLDLSSLKSVQSKNQGKTVKYRPKHLSNIVSPQKIERLRQTLNNSRKHYTRNLAFNHEDEAGESVASNILTNINNSPSQLQYNSGTVSLSHESGEKSRKGQDSSMIQIQYSNEDNSQDPCFAIVETFGNIRSHHSIHQKTPKLNPSPQQTPPTKQISLHIHKTVAISFISHPSKPFSIKSHLSKNKIENSIALTDIEEIQAEHTNKLMTKLTEMATLNSRWTIMKDRLHNLVRANEKITLDYKALKSELDSERKEHTDKMQQLEAKVLTLKQQMQILDVQNKQQETEIMNKQGKLKETLHLNERYVRENNDLKKQLKAEAELIKLMRIELSSNCTQQTHTPTLSRNESVPVFSSKNHRKTYTEAEQPKPSSNPYPELLRFNIQKDVDNYQGLQTAPAPSRGQIIKNHKSPDSSSSRANLLPQNQNTSIKFNSNLKIGYIGNSARSNVSSRGSSKGSNRGYLIDFMLPEKQISEQLDLSIGQQLKFGKTKRAEFLTDKFAVKQKSLQKREKKA